MVIFTEERKIVVNVIGTLQICVLCPLGVAGVLPNEGD